MGSEDLSSRELSSSRRSGNDRFRGALLSRRWIPESEKRDGGGVNGEICWGVPWGVSNLESETICGKEIEDSRARIGVTLGGCSKPRLDWGFLTTPSDASSEGKLGYKRDT
ncbi:MAG: hypothetical protein WBB29_12105 [Geitlerinemataceae cyanobacterium]